MKYLPICALFVLGLAGCRTAGASSGSLPPSGNFDRAKLLAAFADTLQANYAEFATHANTLDGAVQALAADKSSAPSTGASQAAWRTAMNTWQRVEGMQVGPLAVNTAPGGRDLREPIYNWPLQSRCAVEQAIVEQAYTDPNFAAIAFANVRGLGALEYLLFYAGKETECSADHPIVKNGSWAALTEAERAVRVRTYAAVLSKDLRERSVSLVDAWSDSKGNFGAELRTAGRGGKVYPTEQAAFNAVSDAVITISLYVKNAKVGQPLGVVKCTKATCPEALESVYAQASGDNVRANLESMRQLMFGRTSNGDLGFDDLLLAVGAGSRRDCKGHSGRRS
jgi:uncharacterized protein